MPGATIRYTLNGTAPWINSPIYTGPFYISGSATVQASTFLKGQNPSWPSVASYTVESGSPTVNFVSQSASGPAGGYNPILTLSAIPAGTVTVNYSVRASTGATTTGVVSFLPSNNYRYFPITVTGVSGTETTVTITSVTGGVIGSNRTLVYTVQ